MRLALSIIALSFALTVAPQALASDDDLFGDEALASDEDDLGDLGDLKRGGTPTDDKKKKPTTTTTDDSDLLEEDEELGIDEPEEGILGDFEGDLDSAPSVVQSVGPGPISLAVAGKVPMADNYPLSVVAVDRDAVVVELPVLLSGSRSSVSEPFTLIGEVWVGATKVGEVRQFVTPASLAEFGPSFAFLKVSAPVVERAGEIKVVVKKAGADGNGGTEIFNRVTAYALR